MWQELVNSAGWKEYQRILSVNIKNFSLNVQKPALSLDQLIEANSAAHRLDALRHAQGIVQSMIDDAKEALTQLRKAQQDETGESNDTVYQKFRD